MGNSEVSLAAAFAAGVVSFASPCVLPLVPVYLAMLAGTGSEGADAKRRLVINSGFFLLGFTVVFIAMGATASLIGQLLIDYRETVRRAGGVLIMLMGAQTAGLIRVPGLERRWGWSAKGALTGPLGAFVLGLAFTVGWTPCIGPILAAILTLAGLDGRPTSGLLLLAAYSVGFAVPFIIFSLVCQRYFPQIRRLYRWLPVLQKTTGALLLVMGLAIYFNWLNRGLGIILGG